MVLLQCNMNSLGLLSCQQTHEGIQGMAAGNVDLSLLVLKQCFTFNSVVFKKWEKNNWNFWKYYHLNSYLFSTKQGRLVFLMNWLSGGLKATPGKDVLIHRGKPLYRTFSSNLAQFVTCFCLNLEIAGINLILPTTICFFCFSVVDVAPLGSIQLCYFYTCWEPCMCRSPNLHSSDRKRLCLHDMKEVLEAPDVNDSFQIIFCHQNWAFCGVEGKQLKNTTSNRCLHIFFPINYVVPIDKYSKCEENLYIVNPGYIFL